MILLSKKNAVRSILTVFFSVLFLSPLHAQNNRRHRIYDAYIHGNRAQWVQIVGEMEHSVEPKTLSWKLELAEYYYGMTAYYLGMKQKELAAIVITKENDLIDGVLKEYPNNATAMAFKGSMTAFKINLNRLNVMTLGRESLNWMDKALKADPENVQALADRGNAFVHAPALFGGDPEKGILYFRKGLAILERKNQVAGNWFYLQLLVNAADALKRINHPDKARQYYERALRVEPRFRFVKETLLPALNKKS